MSRWEEEVGRESQKRGGGIGRGGMHAVGEAQPTEEKSSSSSNLHVLHAEDLGFNSQQALRWAGKGFGLAYLRAV